MTRDELLTKLAMELADWPHGNNEYLISDGNLFSQDEWLAERERLNNCEQRLAGGRLSDDVRHVTPAELLNRQLIQRNEELEEANAALVDENKTLRRLIGDLAA